MRRNQLGRKWEANSVCVCVCAKIFACEKETTFETNIRREVLLCTEHHKATHTANTARQGPASLGQVPGTRQDE